MIAIEDLTRMKWIMESHDSGRDGDIHALWD
jgi:hypothetical protein